MKNQLTGLVAGALLSVAAYTAAHAATASDLWIAQARAELQARVAAAGLADDGKTVAIAIKATSDDKRYAPVVARSSGSADFDAAVRSALKGVSLEPPPIELNGRRVTFTLGEPAQGAAQGSN